MAFGLHKNHHEMIVLVLFAIAMVVTVSASTMDGLTGYWPLDEGSGVVARDVVGGNDGNLEAGVNWVAGKVGPFAMETNSESAGIRVPTNPAYMTPNVSMSCWAITEAAGWDVWSGIVGHFYDTRSTEAGWGLYEAGTVGVVEWYASQGGGMVTVSVSNVPTGLWNHWVGTVSDSRIRLYLNGQEVDSAPFAGGVDYSEKPAGWDIILTIGTYVDDNENDYFNGSVDEVAIWDRALTAEEVSFLYNDGRGRRVDDGVYIEIRESGGNTEVTEGGEADSYEVSINAEPSDTVRITATPADAQIDLGNGPGMPLVLIFTAENRQTSQTVNVRAFDDDIFEGKNAHKTMITHTADGGQYTGVNIAPVEVTVIDNELTCGDWGYFVTDLNRDCYVDLQDFATFAMEWLNSPD